MKINVKRFEYGDKWTVSKVYIDGVEECYALEDKVREPTSSPAELVTSWKVDGETAIPKGTYRVIVDYSNHFQRSLPHILNVPGFAGVRIHTGNTDKDTEGCLLLGTTWAGTDFVGNSAVAFGRFFVKLQEALDAFKEVTIQIGDSLEDFG